MKGDARTPEPRFRWVVAFSAALILAIAMGTLVNGMSAFLVPLEEAFGWSRAETAAINSFGLIGIAIGGILMGFLADNLATRTVCLIGSAAMCLALITSAYATTLWQFYALFFIAGALGGGAFFAPIIALVGGWFRTGAGLAIGIASAGQAVGQGLVPYGSGYLIETVGWQGALTYLGIICAVTLVPLSFAMIDPPKQGTAAFMQGNDVVALSPRLALPALSIAVLGCCAGMAVPLIHLVPLIQIVCGVGAEAGGPLLLMLVTAIAGRVFFGRLADTIGPLRAWMLATAWQTALMLGFMLLGSLEAFWIFAVLYGFGYGGVMTGVLVSVRALTPQSRRASATGIVLAFAWLGHAAGGWQGGLTFDITGAYFWAFANATVFGLINLAIIGTIYLVLRQRTMPSG
ncbi:MFS transporter [Seohaeicola saemankumensis]|nr:MFS transporter [Seohaeicola saemankumensis]MCA0869549.1 MFS transporter [Seohaeicola saemankumensis]